MTDALLLFDVDIEVADHDNAAVASNILLSAAELARCHVALHDIHTVLLIEGDAGDLVEAAASDPVMRVIDPHRLEVIAAVPLADAARIRPGEPAHLAGAASWNAEPPLKVVSRPVAVDQGTATVPVRLAFATPAVLAAGTPVQVEIEAEQHVDAVLVPAAAIVREGDGTFVLVAAGGKAHRRPVTIGLSSDDLVEIVSGVQPGDLVIVDGHAGLPDEAAITIGETKEGT